jgi:hypothetical protein
MWRFHRLLAVIVLSALSQTAHAIPFTFEGRSLGMGGVGVATANLATAPWANPAMLTNQPKNSDWSLLIGLGAFVRDDDDLAGDVDDYQDADDRRKAADNPEDEGRALLEMASIIGGIEEKIIAPEATALFAIGASFESFAMAISARADIIAGGVVTDVSADRDDLISDQFNILSVEGVLATEFGVSFARDFQLWNRKVSIGIKPKIVELEAYTFQEAILTIDTDDIIDDDDNKSDLGTFETIDLGFAIDLSDSVRLGLSLRNLLNEEFDLGDQTLNLDTEARLGIAYYNKFLTIAADLDLIENEPLLANDSFDGLRTQYLAVGAEFNAFEYVKFRLGASKNIASDISDGAEDIAYTAGVGFWLGFNLDIAALINDNTAGVFLQTGFQF